MEGQNGLKAGHGGMAGRGISRGVLNQPRGVRSAVRAANTRRGVQARNSQLSSLRERQINSPHGAGRRPNKEDHARALLASRTTPHGSYM